MLRLLLRVLSLLFGHVVFTMRTGVAKGLKRRYGLGFRPRLSLAEEEKFLLGLDLRGHTVYDVGGYIGIMTLFFSRAVGEQGRVVTFEPNPRNYEELLANLRLNPCRNVSTFPFGVGDEAGELEMVTDPLYPTRGTFADTKKPALRARRGHDTYVIKVVSLDEFIAEQGLPLPDLVKIDTEGFEAEVLRGMSRTLEERKPALFVELHGRAVESVVGLLLSSGYSIHHVESNSSISTSDPLPVSAGHLYCV
ncbi:MAG TPA: FkbM family methyltransferase [Planctomycetota bacterium]|nr:FkbM family methyltransferase [Planctomycetota bacterium]